MAMGINRAVLYGSAFLLALSVPVVADDSFGAGSRAIRIDLAGLDLNTEGGHELAYTRLRHAAAEVCGYESEFMRLGSVQRAQQSHKCYHDALQRAVDQIDNDLLSAHHEWWMR